MKTAYKVSSIRCMINVFLQCIPNSELDVILEQDLLVGGKMPPVLLFKPVSESGDPFTVCRCTSVVSNTGLQGHVYDNTGSCALKTETKTKGSRLQR